MTKIRSSIISLIIVAAVIFGMAFKCGRDNPNDPDPTPTPGRNTRNTGLTENIVKNYIKEYEEKVNPPGGSGAPNSIEVTFDDIEIGQPRDTNEEDKLRGAKSGGVYPVSVRYTLIKNFRTEDIPVDKASFYEFYQNAQGLWEAFYIGPAS